MKTFETIIACAAALVLAVIVGLLLMMHHNQAKIEAKAEARNRRLEDVPVFDIDATIHARDEIAVEALRRQLIRLIWNADSLPTGHPDVVDVPGGFRVDMADGINSNVRYFDHGKSCLVLFHIGHALAGDTSHPEVVDELADTCDVLLFYMPLTGPNSQPVVNTNQGPLKLTSHDDLAVVDLPYNALRLFVDPVLQVLNRVGELHHYDRIAVIGHSGGGWTTTLYAALDRRIDLSIPIAGSLPLWLLSVAPVAQPGDFEQHNPDLLKIVNYLDLYVMATDGFRKQLQILNRLDDQAFAGDASAVYADAVTMAAMRVRGLWAQDIENNNHHQLSGRENGVIMDVINYWAKQQVDGEHGGTVMFPANCNLPTMSTSMTVPR